jgi:ribosomal protein L11 methyltransferase
MPDRWLVLSVRAPSDEHLEELAEGLVTLGGSAVQEEGDLLTTYLPSPGDPEPTLAAARERLGELLGEVPEVRWWWQEDQDWSRAWRQGLAPRRVGERLVVCQPWNQSEAAGLAETFAEAVVVVIDPATAFGTGEHATTRGALRLMEAVIQGGERVLDVGTGSGILALAAAGLGAGAVVAVESDPDSMGNAAENLDRSPWRGEIELLNDLVNDELLARRRGAGFHLIVANVLSSVLVPLLPGFAGALTAGGALILGGILEEEAPRVLEAAAAAGFGMVAEDREAGWWTALLRGEGG